MRVPGTGICCGVIYLDCNATSPMDPAVLEAMLPFLQGQFANPSASYGPARLAHKSVEHAREQVAGRIGALPDEIIFTSGGTESDNAAVDTARMLWPRKRHLVIGATEHSAVMEPARRWVRDGGTLSTVPVDRWGRHDLEALRQSMRPGETALLSLMWINNETGVISPVKEAAHIAHEAGALVHVDAVQALGRLPVDVRALPVDFLSLSAHKFHGAKGTGALWVNRQARFRPFLLGGGQENGRRSGTENVPGIVAMGMAAALADPAQQSAIAAMRDAFESRITTAMPEVILNGHANMRVATTSNLCFPGLSAAEMLILLDGRGVCCSAGSACHTADVHPSHVLEAMGLDAAHAASSLRFSFSRFNTMAEALTAADHVVAVAGKIRSLRAEEPGPVVISGGNLAP